MSKKKPSNIHPEDPLRLDEAAADQMAADMAAAVESQRGVEIDAIELLKAELQAVEDRLLRSRAELENYRKRIAREMQEELRYANLPLIRELLPVLDNLRRAIEAAENTHDTATLLEGVKMVVKQLEETFSRHGCVRIEALHEPFDPHLHEAISQQASAEHPDNTVLTVAQDGFRLHDRVVRPSQVIVSTATSPDPPGRDDERNNDYADL